MSTVSVTLSGLEPPPRHPPATGGWINARMEEAADVLGAAATVIEPVLDPTQESFTSDHATLPAGWYRIVYEAAGNAEQPTDWIFNGASIAPTVRDVAALMPDRATLDGGDQAPTFTDDGTTTPSAAEVEHLIGLVVDAVAPRVPAAATASVLRAARAIVTLDTAILAETGSFSEQTDVNTTRVTQWERLLDRYNQVLDALTGIDTTPGGGSGTPDVTPHYPGPFLR